MQYRYWKYIWYHLDKNYTTLHESDKILLLNQLKTIMWDRKEPIQSFLNTQKLIFGCLEYEGQAVNSLDAITDTESY